ncbi:hypothetical protein SDC9_191656 [bioreactor metagenome]|uniref:Uncharacterized protein n=1 Tax=bioreactor metagenome TaxID=1076179 RepID=A0A645HYH1_9ZZZZ
MVARLCLSWVSVTLSSAIFSVISNWACLISSLFVDIWDSAWASPCDAWEVPAARAAFPLSTCALASSRADLASFIFFSSSALISSFNSVTFCSLTVISTVFSMLPEAATEATPSTLSTSGITSSSITLLVSAALSPPALTAAISTGIISGFNFIIMGFETASGQNPWI